MKPGDRTHGPGGVRPARAARRRASCSPAWSALTWLLPLIALPLLPVTTAQANPIPSALLLTHVHPHAGSFCNELPVTDCGGIVQTTPLTGELAFDLILVTLDPDPFSGPSQIEARWPEDWTYIVAEACSPGAEVIRTAEGVTLHLPSLAAAPRNDCLVGLARIILDVPSEGRFEITSYDGYLGTEPAGARAGLACGTCFRSCSFGYPLRPRPLQRTLELEVPEGQSVSEVIAFDSEGFYPMVDYTFAATEAWMELAVEYTGHPDWPTYDVTVTADASSLSPGVYSGWVEAHCPDCYECTEVVLTVLGAYPPATIDLTWGRLKERFR